MLLYDKQASTVLAQPRITRPVSPGVIRNGGRNSSEIAPALFPAIRSLVPAFCPVSHSSVPRINWFVGSATKAAAVNDWLDATVVTVKLLVYGVRSTLQRSSPNSARHLGEYRSVK